ncbi:MAG: hypothetical protein JWP87_1623 [Labilithrix sp.]|nr:hypothetical protein [Labilithrix sp.]
MSFRRVDMVSVGVIGLSAALTAAVYERLPERMATHFDLAGNPNGWMPRAMGAWFAPVFGLGLWAFIRFLPAILPKSDRRRLGDSSAPLVAAMTAMFMAAVHVLVLYVALVPGASLARAIWIVLGALYVALGLVIPRVKRNAIIGIRTPWSLTSDENWARTQRVGGYAMVIGGLAAAAFGVLGGPTGGIVAIAALIVSALIPAGYSLVLARRQDQGS